MKIAKNHRLILVLLLLIMCTSFVYAQERTVKLATIDYQPYYGQDLEDYGFISEIIETAYEKQGYEVKIEFMSWTDALEKVKSGEYDGIYTLWYRKDREQFYAYSDALPPNEVVFCKLQQRDISYKEYIDLAQYTLGVAKDYTYPDEVLNAGLTTKEGANDAALLEMLYKKEVDLIIIDRAQAKYITRQDYPTREKDLDCFDKPIIINNQYIGFSKNVSDYAQKLLDFNAGLTEIVHTGEYDEILEKYGYEEFAKQAVLLEEEIGKTEDIDFEELGKDIAKEFSNFLDKIIEDTLEFSKIDFSNQETAKEKIKEFSDSRKKEIWINIGSDENPIEQRKKIPLYHIAKFVDKDSNEIIKYKGEEFTEELADVLKNDVGKLMCDNCFPETIALPEGIVRIGKVMTHYTSKEEVFAELPESETDKYEKVISRDVMKQGFIRFSTPVYKDGELQGVAALMLDYRHLQELSKHINPVFKEPVVSNSYEENYLLVFDIDGNTIIHPKPDNIRGYLDDGRLAGYNDGIDDRPGNIFNLYKYHKTDSYAKMAEAVLKNKEIYTSSATDVSGRTKLTVTVPILYDNPKTIYKDIGVFGGIMMSINLEEVKQDIPLWIYLFSGLIILFFIVLGIIISFRKRIFQEKTAVRTYSIRKKLLISFGVVLLLILLLIIFTYNNGEVFSKNIVSGSDIEDSLRIISTRTNLSIIIGIVSIILGVVVSFLMSNSIIRPIEKLKEATEELEKGNFGIRTDIKSRDELEILGDTFNKTAEVLEKREAEHKQLERAKTEFLSITSHELRSPMTPMRAQLQMLDEEYFGKLNVKQRAALRTVLRNTERLDKIILDFLEISRIEAARLKFNFIKTDLTKYLKRVIDGARATAPAKNLKFVVNIEKLPVIEVDPDRVMQVLRNLLNNAVKFCRLGCIIEVSVKRKGESILFMVKDNGPGISPKIKEKIFEPFFQGEETMYREHGGVGLGLAICKGIVKSQRGRIWVESEGKNKGSAFYFTVPLKPTKDITPIKILFSNQVNIEEKVRKCFAETLGPIGHQEFERLKKERGISKKSLEEYMMMLVRKGVIQKEKVEECKEKVDEIFGKKNIDGEMPKLEKRGFIKKRELSTLKRPKITG